MHLILIIAAGILLAFVLLPFLGPIVMVAIYVAVIALIGYVIISVGVVAISAIEGATRTTRIAQWSRIVQKRLFKVRVKTTPEFNRGLTAIDQLLILQGLRQKPIGLWYLYILNERFRNCYMTGVFRVEDQLNRAHLEKYLKKAISNGSDSTTTPRAEALCQEILDCHDSLCTLYQKKK